MIRRIIFISLFVLINAALFGQAKVSKNHPLTGLTCKTCHSCNVPTSKDPCLNACPRAEMTTVNQTPAQSPEVEVMKELSNRYAPVVFPHRTHAQMSEMSGGCQTCHHFNTIGPIQPCINCHETKRQRDDISKPDLEAAYHQQCINCHREWSHRIDCTSCHAEKGSNESAAISSSIKKMTGKIHPEIAEPKKLIFETKYKSGKYVTFYHDEHVKVFGANCVDCHKQQNCSQCHDKGKATMIVTSLSGAPIKMHKPEQQHHKPCFSCHQDDKCSTCHLEKPSGPFNHEASTGWALNKFHENLSCSKCHGSVKKFEKLDPACTSCHNNFIQGKFDHSAAGLKLDENHSSLECENCHENKDFSKPPICSSCHDDKNFPKDRPGKTVGKIPSKKIKSLK